MTMIAKAAGLAMLLAPASAAMATESATPSKIDQSNCVPQPDCRIDYTNLPPGRSSGMRKGMTHNQTDETDKTNK